AGVAVIQSPEFDGEMIHVTTMLIHESGAMLEGRFSLRPSKLDPQGVGSALTYARRYALLSMTGAAPEDDDGASASGPRQDTPRPEPKRTDPAPMTLAQRADKLEATLKGVKTATDLRRAYDLGAKLCAELDAAAPERLVKINALYEARFSELS